MCYPDIFSAIASNEVGREIDGLIGCHCGVPHDGGGIAAQFNPFGFRPGGCSLAACLVDGTAVLCFQVIVAAGKVEGRKPRVELPYAVACLGVDGVGGICQNRFAPVALAVDARKEKVGKSKAGPVVNIPTLGAVAVGSKNDGAEFFIGICGGKIIFLGIQHLFPLHPVFCRVRYPLFRERAGGNADISFFIGRDAFLVGGILLDCLLVVPVDLEHVSIIQDDNGVVFYIFGIVHQSFVRRFRFFRIVHHAVAFCNAKRDPVTFRFVVFNAGIGLLVFLKGREKHLVGKCIIGRLGEFGLGKRTLRRRQEKQDQKGKKGITHINAIWIA